MGMRGRGLPAPGQLGSDGHPPLRPHMTQRQRRGKSSVGNPAPTRAISASMGMAAA
jgi:hypothetical protein